jgi:hypothetical protein
MLDVFQVKPIKLIDEPERFVNRCGGKAAVTARGDGLFPATTSPKDRSRGSWWRLAFDDRRQVGIDRARFRSGEVRQSAIAH